MKARELKSNPLNKVIRTDIPGIFNEVNILKKHKDRFLHALSNDVILPPYEVLIHLNGTCNLKCEWCIGGRVLEEKAKGKTLEELGVLPSLLANPNNTERVIKSIISYKKDGFRIENVSFSGITGEPLVAKKAFIRAINLLSSAKENTRTGVYSNSTLIDDEIIEVLLKMNYINISFDAGTPETYAKLKFGNNPAGKELYKKLLSNIKRLSDARRKSKNSRLEINASYLLYPDNYKEIYRAAKILKDLGVRNMKMKQDIYKKRLLSKEQLKETSILIEKIKKIEDDNFRFIPIHRVGVTDDLDRKLDKCLISDLMAAVGSDGNVYPCNYQAYPGGYTFGNAIKTSFKKIWEGKKRMLLRKRLPKVCPSVCDPFKTRANKLFQEIIYCKERYGIKKTKQFVDEIVNEAD